MEMKKIENAEFMKRLAGKKIIKTELSPLTFFFEDNSKVQFEIRLDVGKNEILPYLRAIFTIPD